MNTSFRSAPVLLIVVAVAAVLAATPGEAQARERQTTVTGPQGKSATRAVSRHHGDVQSSSTGPNGKTSSRVVDRSPGQTTATVTGPEGKTATRTSTYGGASAPQP